MKKEQIETNFQKTESKKTESLRAVPSIVYPTAARVVSHGGSNGTYTFAVQPESSQGTQAGDFWETAGSSGGYHHYPVITVEFTGFIPNDSSWVLRNAAGVTVSSGVIKSVSTQNLTIHLKALPHGQPSLVSLETFTLQFSNLVPNSFQNLVIGSTGGGLVIIANVDGCEEYYDPYRVMERAKVELSHFSAEDSL